MQTNVRGLDDLRLDRILIRLVITGSLLAAMLAATGVTSDLRPTPLAALVGAVGGVVAIAGFDLGGAWWTTDLEDSDPVRWRPWQLWSMSLGAAVAVCALPFGGLVWLPYLPIVTVARVHELPRALPFVIAPLIGLVYMGFHQHESFVNVTVNVLIAVVAIVILQQRRRQLEAAELAAAQEQVILQERARSASAERQRDVAAQLHDVLAHTLSGLIVSLQTAGLQARQEDASPQLQQRLSASISLAKEGLAGARDAVESLHGAAAGAEQPLDEWLRRTLDRLRAGAGGDFTVSGEALAIPEERREVARAVLREALTNSVRHAPGLPVRITLSGKEIRVLTTGDVNALPRTDQLSGGHGLSGLRRRVESAGGRFEAGAVPDGWLVCARWV